MNRNTFYIIFGALTFGLLVNSFFVVSEKERAIVFQFGEAVRPDIPVGFHLKLPIIQDVKKYDARIQTLDEEPDRILTVESKYLLVDSFIKYRITNVLTFYKANNGSFNSLNSLLGQRSEFVLKNNFGKRTVKEVVPIDSCLSLTWSIYMWVGRIKAHAELTKNLSLKSIPLSLSSLISLSKASNAKTTPLPIRHLALLCNIPDGIKCSTVFSPFTLMV